MLGQIKLERIIRTFEPGTGFFVRISLVKDTLGGRNSMAR
jgi:hypothetical protein